MITADSPDVYGYTIFCDDIRVEVGGKLTYVGTYTGTLFIQSAFPALLHKIAMSIVYMQRHTIFVPSAKFQIFLPGTPEDTPMTLDLPEEAVQDAITTARAMAKNAIGENSYATLAAQLSLTNLVIQEPGLIRVRVVREDQLIKLGALQVKQHPNFQDSKPATT